MGEVTEGVCWKVDGMWLQLRRLRLYSIRTYLKITAACRPYPPPPPSPPLRFTNLFPGSFYFWLDLLSTFSLIFEIPIFLTAILSSENEEKTSLGSSSGNDGVSAAEQAKAGKASRAGAKAGRVVKIIRMVRLIRLVKLFKYAEQTKTLNDNKESQVVPEEEEEEEEMLPER